jgi:hypothetical protein
MLVLVLAMLFALSRSDDTGSSVDTPRGTLFKSKNLKAGSFDGLWSKRWACRDSELAFRGDSDRVSSMSMIKYGQYCRLL